MQENSRRGAECGPLRIMLVEDNDDVAASLTLLMQCWKHNVRTAQDGAAALEVAQEFQPHVVLLDIGLPKLNGYQVAQHLRQQPEFARTILVALTGYGQEEDRRRSHQAGFDHHMVKPVEPSDLKSLLDSVTIVAG